MPAQFYEPTENKDIIELREKQYKILKDLIKKYGGRITNADFTTGGMEIDCPEENKTALARAIEELAAQWENN